jgi:(E)-4-hydroxy-3-methylbut-2-enyl-diphosphate synthase
VPNRRAAQALRQIAGRSALPVVADVHFDPALALRSIEAGAAGVRVNPGNIADEDGLRRVYREAAAAGVKVRIGLNSGSVRPRSGMEVREAETGEDLAELMVRRALAACREAEGEGCRSLVVSLKASDVPTTLRAYRLAAARCDYPLHLGVTAAGPAETSLVKSAVGIGALLAEGIGDTIRVSMTGPPHEEVRAGLSILEALELRRPRGPEIISCPTCGRCNIDLQGLVQEVGRRLEGCERRVRVAIMGCVVNGPGEAAEADVGVAGGRDFGYIFREGRKTRRVRADGLADALMEEIRALE